MARDERDPIGEPPGERPSFKVDDRRHWARPLNEHGEQEENTDRPEAEPEPRPAAGDTLVDSYRSRAEQAEAKLHEYIGAFRQSQADADAFRERLARDLDRKVELRFAALVRELLSTVDDLELAQAHMAGVVDAAPLTRGVSLAVQHFLQILERHGVVRISPEGEPFDPAVAEAVRVDPVEDPALDGVVTETMRPGYRLGDQLVRPAAVAVGRASR
ncbi:MAG TPA: nucleotide exchange factor GrpE [Candidatus Polarisedimenticolaceae bacterium]|nr:nucleotide exchange factor GrpE [Candidatus Polarisedimenticolaceae bacterium]